MPSCPRVERFLIMSIDIVWASTIASQIMQLARQLICAGYCSCAVILIIPGPFSRFEVSSITTQSAGTHRVVETYSTEHKSCTLFDADECFPAEIC